MRGRLQVWLGALALVAAAVCLRWPALPREIWNLDEANTCVFAQHVLQGDVLYRDAVDTRGPLMVYLLAAELRVVGDWNMTGLHLALTLMLGLTAILLWRTVVRLGGGGAGAWAAAVFTLANVLYIDPVDAFTTHTEWFVLFFSALGFWLLAHAWHRLHAGLAGLAGVSFGLSYLAKQPGLLDAGTAVVWIGLYLWFDPTARRERFKMLGMLAAGLTTVALAAPLYFWLQGALRDYQFWVWTYSTRYYLPEVTAADHWRALGAPFVLAWQQMPWFALGAVIAVAQMLRSLARSLGKQLAGQEVPLLALGWASSGVFASALGGRSFDHYSIQAIPGLSLLAGWALNLAWTQARTATGRGRGRALLWRSLALLPFALGAVQAGRRLSSLDLEPSPAKAVGEVVRACTQPSERIFIWGFYPEVAYHAQRISASRFAFANFLTGMIPWTNLDPDKDTTYAIVPGAWNQLWTDFERHPPAVIIDTNVHRGYGKYPLTRQARLWNYLQTNYVEIEAGRMHSRGFRVYRRTGEPLVGTPSAVPDPALRIQPEFPEGTPSTAFHVRPPTGFVAAELLVNGRSLGAVALAAEQGHQLTFTYRAAVHGRNPVITAQAQRRDGSLAIGPAYRIADLPSQPVIACGSFEVPALESTCLSGPLVWLPREQVFSSHAPARLVFPRPPTLMAVTFDFGMFDGAYAPERRPPTDGIELQVSFEPEHGPSRRLFTRALYPQTVLTDRGRQRVTVDLPPHESGRIVLVLSAGRQSDASSDWAYIGPIQGMMVPLTLTLGKEKHLPVDFDAPLGMALVVEDGRPVVLIHAPASIEFMLPADLRSLSGEFGMTQSSWQNSRGHTAGIDFIAEHVAPDGRVTTLWRQRLDPARVPLDRGIHRFHFPLPVPSSGRVRLRSAAAYPPDNSYGYSCWANLVAHPTP